jgi:hypothetical protein
MIRTHRVLKDIEPEIAFFFPAGFGQLAKQVRDVCALGADIDVCDYEYAAAASVIVSGAQRQSLIRPLVVIAQPHRVDLISEVLGIRRCGMGIKVSAVGPRFNDAEVCGPSGLLEELDPLESVVFSACIPVLLESSDRCGSGCRQDIDIGDRIGGTIRRRLRAEKYRADQ